MPDIAIYVQRNYIKNDYKRDFYDLRIWAGIEMVRHALKFAGYEVSYCSAATVDRHKIILVSITSPLDWYSFIQERVLWPRGEYKVVVGGAGVLNIRPVLEFADVFVFGRGEGLVVNLVRALLENQRYDHRSVCYADSFGVDNEYEIAQASNCYTHEILLPNGAKWNEAAIGCQRKCLFCHYSWSRRFIGTSQFESGAIRARYNTAEERTIFDYNLNGDYGWKAGRQIIGLDGVSQRLRFMVNKPITHDMIVRFLAGVTRQEQSIYRLRVYTICGYPTETEDEYEDILTVAREADQAGAKRNGHKPPIEFHFTPFNAMPATPCAVWPMQYFKYRDWLPKRFKLRKGKFNFFTGDTLSVSLSWSTESLQTTTLIALALRGIEADTSAMRLLATSKEFWLASGKAKRATLEKYFDTERLFSAYTWSTLPTRYLKTYNQVEAMAKMSDKRLRQYGGADGAILANLIRPSTDSLKP